MKAHLKYFTIICFLIQSNLNAQLNLPLKFQEDVVKWSELSWMEGELNINNHRFSIPTFPVVIDDTLYLFENYYHNILENGRSYGHCGYSIKKINKNTGEKYWELHRKYKEYFTRKVISQPKFNNNTIDVTLYDEAEHNLNQGTIWSYGYPAHISVSRANGNIVDSNYVDKTDSQLPKIVTPGRDHYPLNGSSNAPIYKSDNGYFRIYQEWKDIIEFRKYDLSGKLISLDTINYPEFKFKTWDFRLEKVKNDSFMLVLLNKKDNEWSDFQVLFSKYDKDMVLDTSIDVSEHFNKNITAIGILYFDKGYFVIYTQLKDQDAKTQKEAFYAFNHKGEFVDSISYTLRPGIDDIIKYGWIWSLVDIVNNRLLLTQSRQNKFTESTSFQLYENDGDTIRTVSKIHVVGVRDHFRTRFVTTMDNGDILMYIEQVTDVARQDQFWHSWIMLDGQKIFQYTGTDDHAQEPNKLKVYPNPTSNLITIEGLDHEANVTIYNLKGQPVKNTVTNNHQTDISDLPGGMYILEIDNGTYKERHKVIKVE